MRGGLCRRGLGLSTCLARSRRRARSAFHIAAANLTLGIGVPALSFKVSASALDRPPPGSESRRKHASAAIGSLLELPGDPEPLPPALDRFAVALGPPVAPELGLPLAQRPGVSQTEVLLHGFDCHGGRAQPQRGQTERAIAAALVVPGIDDAAALAAAGAVMGAASSLLLAWAEESTVSDEATETGTASRTEAVVGAATALSRGLLSLLEEP